MEDYFRKFGCYPSAILADRIYQTRRNKMFCAQLGIRLSGPPLGRRKASETDTKIKRQIDRDACERNVIEGRNGNAKRRFGLDRLFSKLDETAKAEAALIILAMKRQPPAGLLAYALFPFPSVLVHICSFFSKPYLCAVSQRGTGKRTANLSLFLQRCSN